jgi:hypothetical protein
MRTHLRRERERIIARIPQNPAEPLALSQVWWWSRADGRAEAEPPCAAGTATVDRFWKRARRWHKHRVGETNQDGRQQLELRGGLLSLNSCGRPFLWREELRRGHRRPGLFRCLIERELVLEAPGEDGEQHESKHDDKCRGSSPDCQFSVLQVHLHSWTSYSCCSLTLFVVGEERRRWVIEG